MDFLVLFKTHKIIKYHIIERAKTLVHTLHAIISRVFRVIRNNMVEC